MRWLPAGVIACVVAMVISLSACGADATAARHLAVSTAPPFTLGNITLVDPVRGYLVEVPPGGLGSPPQVYFRATSATDVEWDSGKGGTIADLRVGQLVAVWTNLAAIDSQPPQIIASHVLIY